MEKNKKSCFKFTLLSNSFMKNDLYHLLDWFKVLTDNPIATRQQHLGEVCIGENKNPK